MNEVTPVKRPKGDTFKKAIIIVEDDLSNAEVLGLLLQTEDAYQVTCFHTGQEVLTHLDIIKALRPALFVLDYQLPKMNGLELYRQLHATDGLEKVPVVVLSGSKLSDEQKKSMLQQGLFFIPKPYDIDDLLSTFEQIVG